MLDRNGTEIRTGDIVEISGAYFKNDNGFWFVENSAGDPNWSGKDHSLRKISGKGKISKAKRNLCFWPLMITTNSWEKRAAAHEWNAEHARIEVIKGIDRTEISRHFKEKADEMDERIKWDEWHFGEGCQDAARDREIKRHYESVSKRVLTEA